MLYREVGQFKTNYSADQAIFPIRQDLIVVIGMIAVAYLAIPFLASEYLVRSHPVADSGVSSLAALGLNVAHRILRTDLSGHRWIHGGRSLRGVQDVDGVPRHERGRHLPDQRDYSPPRPVSCSAFPACASRGSIWRWRPSPRSSSSSGCSRRWAGFPTTRRSGTIGAPHREFLGVVISGPRTPPELKYLIALTFLVFFCIIVKNLTRGTWVGP